MTFTSVFKKINLIILHLLAIGVIGVFFWPIVSWYIHHRPILGVDFYNTATFIKFFKENLHLFQQNFLDFWYAGAPANSYPIMNWFRVFSLIAQFFPVQTAIKYTSLGSAFLLLVFVYLGTVTLSKNPFVATALTLLVLSSSNLYGSLTWGGSLPYFANQLFFPFLLWLLASFLESGNKRWYYFAIIILGLAVTGHIGNASAFYLPAAIVLLFLGKRSYHAGLKVRIKETLLMIVGIDLLVYRYYGQFWLILLNTLQTLLNSLHLFKLPATDNISNHPVVTDPAITYTQQVAAFYRNSFYKVFTDTNQLLLIGLGLAAIIFLLAVVISKRKRESLGVVAWVLLCIYSLVHVYLNANGVVFLSQGWYRAFWQFPITAAFLTASLIGTAQSAVASRGKVLNIGLFLVWTAIAITLAGASYLNNDLDKTIATLETQSSPSSAYPEALNLFKTEADFERLKNSLLPSWLNANDKNFRHFTDDAQEIVWWNALFDIPQARGYLDPPGNTNQHHLLDQAIAGNGLVENYKYDESIARNMALYYLDWYAIRSFEGGHVSQSPNKTPSTYIKDAIAEITDVQTQGVYFLYATKSGKPEIHEEVTQYLKYYRFKDEVTSPIVSISNAPTLACFCDFPAYESLIKILSMHDIYSRKLISLYLPDVIDTYTLKELKNFDVILLSNYKYKNRSKTFGLLEEYLKSGGKLIFDTGGEVKESQSRNLPEWFPFNESKRSGLGREWELEADTKNEIFQDLNTAEFALPLFEKNEWNFSYPAAEPKTTAVILLKQKNQPLLIRSEVGKGILYWSGMNLIYHTQYYTNIVESRLFVNILKSLVPLETIEQVNVNPQFTGSNIIDIQSPKSGRGILIKRQMYDNWSAKVNGQSARIIKAGPSFPGFMYIPLNNTGPISARVRFIGNYTIYAEWFLSVVMVMVLLDLSLLNGALLAKYARRVWEFFYKKTSKWWEKEEE